MLVHGNEPTNLSTIYSIHKALARAEELQPGWASDLDRRTDKINQLTAHKLAKGVIARLGSDAERVKCRKWVEVHGPDDVTPQAPKKKKKRQKPEEQEAAQILCQLRAAPVILI